MSIDNVSGACPTYQTLLRAIGEGAHDLHGSSWERAEAASRELWPSYERSTGLSWSDVRKDIRSAWEHACRLSLK